jgi:hypothetical protein
MHFRQCTRWDTITTEKSAGIYRWHLDKGFPSVGLKSWLTRLPDICFLGSQIFRISTFEISGQS